VRIGDLRRGRWQPGGGAAVIHLIQAALESPARGTLQASLKKKKPSVPSSAPDGIERPRSGVIPRGSGHQCRPAMVSHPDLGYIGSSQRARRLPG
jgi:hypothetical protein